MYVSAMMFLNPFLLLLMSVSINAEPSLLANVKCQFISPCDLVHILRPVIDTMDAQITRLSHFEKNSLMKIYELVERVDILEEQLGLPYWSNLKTTKKPPTASTINLESSGESDVPIASYIYNDANLLGLNSVTSVRSEPLLVRVTAVENWKDNMQRWIVPSLTNNMEEIFTQIKYYDSLPRKVENHQTQVGNLQQMFLELREQMESLETKNRNLNDQSVETIQIQSEINNDVEDLKVAVSRINGSVDRFANVEQQQIVLEQKFRREMRDESRMFQQKWKGFHDDLHVLIDDVMKLEDRQAAFEDEMREKLTRKNETLDGINELKKQFDRQSEMLMDVPSKSEIVLLWGKTDNVTNQLDTMEQRIKEEFREDLVYVRNFVNASNLPVVLRMEKVESALKWREKQIRVNSINIEDISSQLEQLGKNVSSMQEILNSTLNSISADVSELKLREIQLNDNLKRILSFKTELGNSEIAYDHSQQWNNKDTGGMAGDAVAEFLVLQKPLSSCNFTIPQESSHLLPTFDGRPLTELPNSIITVLSGHTITFRCQDIGNFQFTGDVYWICEDGEWQRDGQEPNCDELLTQEKIENTQVIPRNSIPSIQIITISNNDTIGVTSSGGLMALPGSDLVFICIYPKSLGVLQWSKKTQTKYFIPGRWMSNNRYGQNKNKGDYRYQISLVNVRENQSGTYTCDAGRGRSHSIELIVNELRCLLPSVEENILITATSENRMHSRLSFQCKNPSEHLQWPGSTDNSDIYCLPSGVWSKDFPSCS